jgi:hypothetical protein
MATAGSLRPVTANTRDGVDTRTKDLTTRSGGGDRENVGSNAALEFDDWLWWPSVRLDLVAPTGAGVEGTPIWGAWGRYVTVAQRRMEGSEEAFRYVNYETQVEQAEEGLMRCVPFQRQLDMFYLNEVNRATTSLACVIHRARRELVIAPFMLDFYKTAVASRMADVTKAENARMLVAVRRLQSWCRTYWAPVSCVKCGWVCATEKGAMCKECWGEQEDDTYGGGYYSEDVERGALRPPPPIRIPERDPDDFEIPEDDDDHMYEREGWGPRVY